LAATWQAGDGRPEVRGKSRKRTPAHRRWFPEKGKEKGGVPPPDGATVLKNMISARERRKIYILDSCGILSRRIKRPDRGPEKSNGNNSNPAKKLTEVTKCGDSARPLEKERIVGWAYSYRGAVRIPKGARTATHQVKGRSQESWIAAKKSKRDRV